MIVLYIKQNRGFTNKGNISIILQIFDVFAAIKCSVSENTYVVIAHISNISM